jgi:hypothetical protein
VVQGGVVDVEVMRLEWFMGNTGMSHCRIYYVICKNMTYRDIWGSENCIT